MNAKQLDAHSLQEEAMWRVQVLRRTVRFCKARAKELERMAKEDRYGPSCNKEALQDVLKRIDNVMEWRFVDALGEVVLDSDILTESIDCNTLRIVRHCVACQLEQLEKKEKELQ